MDEVDDEDEDDADVLVAEEADVLVPEDSESDSAICQCPHRGA